MITSFINDLPKKAQKQVLKSVIGSLNSSIIGYARGHIRASKFENISRADHVPTIDDYNDAEAAIAESNVSQHLAELAGLTPMMPPLIIAEKLSIIRNWLAELLIQYASTEYDVPLSIGNTIAFQIKRSPAVNEAALHALADAMSLDFDTLKLLKVKVQDDDKTELTEIAGQIITLCEKFDGKFCDELEIEQVFDSLPVHIQYKFTLAITKALEKAEMNALMDLLKYNRLDGAADSKMIKATKNTIIRWMVQFSTENSTTLDEFVSRGGNLPSIPTLVD